jgi:hypothetical protein
MNEEYVKLADRPAYKAGLALGIERVRAQEIVAADKANGKGRR